MFGEIMYIYRHAYKQDGLDLRKGNFFTIDVFLTFLPLLFVILLVVVIFAPTPGARDYSRYQQQLQQQQQQQQQAGKDDQEEEEDEPPRPTDNKKTD